jgi:hypothetical protein
MNIASKPQAIAINIILLEPPPSPVIDEVVQSVSVQSAWVSRS